MNQWVACAALEMRVRRGTHWFVGPHVWLSSTQIDEICACFERQKMAKFNYRYDKHYYHSRNPNTFNWYS